MKRYNYMRAVRIITAVSHWVVIVMAALLILYITRYTLDGQSFIDDSSYMRLQFWACIVFLADIIVGFIGAEDKKTYARRNIFFFLISVPYLNILHYCGVSLDHTVRYLIHFIPMIRAG